MTNTYDNYDDDDVYEDYDDIYIYPYIWCTVSTFRCMIHYWMYTVVPAL